MTKYGSWRVPWVVPGIALPAHPPGTPPRVHPPPTGTRAATRSRRLQRTKLVVGLISVGQLTLSTVFSVSRTITEVYNLVRIDIFINHSFIPGNKQAGVSNHGTGGVLPQQPSIKHEIDPYSGHRISEAGHMGI